MRKAQPTTEPDGRRRARWPGRLVRALLVLALLLAVPAVNYHIDPSRLYHTSRADSLELQAVELLLEGKNAANLSNCNERLIRREYLRRTGRQLDTVVLGSSRGAMITAEMLGEENFFNLSVSGATTDDLIGLYGYLMLCGQQPDRVVISLDPWMLNDNYVDTRSWEAFGDGLIHAYSELFGESLDRVYQPSGLYDPQSDNRVGLLQLSGELKQNLFSIPYFQSSLQSLANGNYAVYSQIVATELQEGETGVMRADGSYSYPADYRNADLDTVIQRAETSLPDSILGLEDYPSLDTGNRTTFERFVQALTSGGVQVEFLLEPISPVLYDYMKTEPRYATFFQVEELYRSIAESCGIPVAGSFDPYALGLDAGDFYDGYHLRPERVEQLAQALAAAGSEVG